MFILASFLNIHLLFFYHRIKKLRMLNFTAKSCIIWTTRIDSKNNRELFFHETPKYFKLLSRQLKLKFIIRSKKIIVLSKRGWCPLIFYLFISMNFWFEFSCSFSHCCQYYKRNLKFIHLLNDIFIYNKNI